MHRAMVRPNPGRPDDPFLLTIPLPDGETASRELGFAEAKHLRRDIEAVEADAFARQVCQDERHHGQLLEVLPSGAQVMACRHCPAEFVVEPGGDTVPVGDQP